MANVSIELEVVTRAGDFTTQHGLEKDRTDLFQLNTTDTAYGTDLPAFSTTVYNYYAAELGTANVSTVDILYKLWIGGDSTGGGGQTADGVLKVPAASTDITTQLSALIVEIQAKSKPSNA